MRPGPGIVNGGGKKRGRNRSPLGGGGEKSVVPGPPQTEAGSHRKAGELTANSGTGKVEKGNRGAQKKRVKPPFTTGQKTAKRKKGTRQHRGLKKPSPARPLRKGNLGTWALKRRTQK